MNSEQSDMGWLTGEYKILESKASGRLTQDTAGKEGRTQIMQRFQNEVKSLRLYSKDWRKRLKDFSQEMA